MLDYGEHGERNGYGVAQVGVAGQMVMLLIVTGITEKKQMMGG